MASASDTSALRERAIATAQAMNSRKLNRGKSGNVSARIAGGFVVTPSAMAYDALEPADLVAVMADGTTRGRRAPSSEWRLHQAIYAARADFDAIVHAHPPFATALACLDRGIPPFHYMVAVAGGDDIRCAPYATFGTPGLAAHTVDALAGRRACLLSHHGLVAAGADLDRALALAVEVEALAEIYCRALAIGEPALLTPLQMQDVAEQFGANGQREGEG
ncbi:MAG: class II aldolase/adducin family protein [Betaproteobacteria bacterium]